MASLVIAEHDHASLRPATLPVITAAAALGGPVDVLVAGSDCRAAADAAARVPGVRTVLCADAPEYAHQLADCVAPLVTGRAGGYGHVLAAATSTGKDLMPRVAGLLDVAQISEIIGIVDPDTFIRPIYAGNAVATVQALDKIKVLTVRTTAFAPAPATGGAAVVESVAGTGDPGRSRFIRLETTKSERPELTGARVVVAGGRGLQSAENFHLLDQLAQRLGAALGATRAAVDAGFVSNDLQVGQTGKVVAPELYVAVGISGAIQHLAGMKDSKVIVAINKDEEAPIFQIADYGLVADLFKAIPEFIAELEKKA